MQQHKRGRYQKNLSKNKIQVLFSNRMGKKKEMETATRMKIKENN
jgi:hypothetical protein